MLRTADLLANSASLVAALGRTRRRVGAPAVYERFETLDNPEGFFVRVTEYMAQWIVPWDADYQAFEDGGVSFLRTEFPNMIAMGV